MFPSARPNLHEPPPASTVADRLKRARRRRFVGRAAELELFLGALAAPEPPFSVLWIHGPGGVGQDRAAGRAGRGGRGRRRRRRELDLRAIEPSPPAFMAELGRARRAARRGRALRRRRAGRPAARHLRGWRSGSRTGCGSSSSRRCRRVRWSWWRAGRGPARRGGGIPAGATCCAWSPCATSGRTRRGPCCAASGSRKSGTSVDARADARPPARAVAAGGRALAAAGDARGAAPLELGAAPDVVGQLVESFLAGVPSPRHRLRARMRRPTRG